MNFQEFIFSLFDEYLKNEIKDNDSYKQILSKGEKIVNELEELPNEERKGLLVGHVQSGKTMNFLSVMANAIKKGYNVITILSSCENELHRQTVDRVRDSFQYKKCSNYFEIIDCKDSSYNNRIKSEEFIADLIHDYNKKITVFIILKNKKNIDKLTEIFVKTNKKLKKVLIIDDEGDLASLSSKEEKKTNNFKPSTTLVSIKELFCSLNERIYLSVTATPQIHLMLPDINEMMPKRVFVTEHGKGYIGISELYDNKNFYQIISDDENEKLKNNLTDSKLVMKIVRYYLISWSLLMMEEDFSEATDHSNLLIHTDVKQAVHEEYKENIRFKINKMQEDIERSKNNADYQRLIKDIKETIQEFNLKNYFGTDLEEEFLQKLKSSINWCKTKVINQKSDNVINSTLTSVVIGSKKLERGITLENLLATLFINRSKGKTAIDTLLQRARWFGYRNKTLKYMKLFTTQQIWDDFKEIKLINEDILKLLQMAENEKLDFELIDKGIFISDCSKLIPTNKVPLITTERPDLWGNIFLHILESERTYYKDLFYDLKHSDILLKIAPKYEFKSLFFSNFSEFSSKYKNFVRNIFKNKINNKNFSIICNSNYEVVVSLVEMRDGNPRTRKFTKLNNGWGINNALQGSNPDANIGDPNYYPGDLYWRKGNTNLDNKIIIQIHHIIPKLSDDSFREPIFYWYINIPKNINLTKKITGKKYNNI